MAVTAKGDLTFLENIGFDYGAVDGADYIICNISDGDIFQKILQYNDGKMTCIEYKRGELWKGAFIGDTMKKLVERDPRAGLTLKSITYHMLHNMFIYPRFKDAPEIVGASFDEVEREYEKHDYRYNAN